MNGNFNFIEKLKQNFEMRPNSIAVKFYDQEISYSQFYYKVNYLANKLQKMNIKKGDFVVVCFPNSIEMIIAIYSVLAIRAIVLPVEGDAPIGRIRDIVNDSQPKVVLCNKSIHYKFNEFDVEKIIIEKTMFDIIPDTCSLEKLHYSPDDMAFCIYTSGSTGKPKGVTLSYKGILNHAYEKISLLGLTNESKVCLSFNISFVASIWQLIVPILLGGQIIIYENNLIKKPYKFLKKLSDDTIVFISVTPHTLSGYLEYVIKGKSKLPLTQMKHIILTGDKVNRSLVTSFYENYDHIKLINAYGQTECSDDTYHYVIPRNIDTDHIPIGEPIKNISGYILNENLNMVSSGEKGELFLGGIGVADGYLNNKELTAAKFLQTKYCDSLLYRTGDFVAMDGNNQVVYYGRIDNQVKIRGHRIELEEIESHINQYEGIRQSVVIAIELSEADKVLSAFYTSDTDINTADLVNYLSLRIPAYMIPISFKHVEELIQTDNGKIDRKTLLECIELNVNPTPFQEVNTTGSNDVSKRVIGIIASNMDLKISDSISLDLNLENVGINSISFIKIIIALESEFNFEFDDEMLLITKFPTVKSMVEYVESKMT